jgi:hypothetical protein
MRQGEEQEEGEQAPLSLRKNKIRLLYLLEKYSKTYRFILIIDLFMPDNI